MESRLSEAIKFVDAIDQKLEPLTDEQIIKLWDSYAGDTRLAVLAFARALEKLHGIE
jgi:hypothetical protein